MRGRRDGTGRGDLGKGIGVARLVALGTGHRKRRISRKVIASTSLPCRLRDHQQQRQAKPLPRASRTCPGHRAPQEHHDEAKPMPRPGHRAAQEHDRCSHFTSGSATSRNSLHALELSSRAWPRSWTLLLTKLPACRERWARGKRSIVDGLGRADASTPRAPAADAPRRGRHVS